MNKLLKFLLKVYASFIKKEKSYILFESAYNFYDNSFELYKYIKANYPEYKLKYLVTTKEMKKSVPKNNVSKDELLNANNKLKLYKYSLKSKVIFFSHVNYWKKLKVQDSTRIVYLNHGEFPIKDCKEYYDFLFDDQENKIDIVMGTKHIDEVLSKKYPVLNNHPHVIIGAPRNDEMFNPNVSKNEFLTKLGAKSDKNTQLIVSMTTFRHRNEKGLDYFKDEFPIALNEADLKELNNKLINNNQILLIKLHHSQSGVNMPNNLSNIYFLNNKGLEDLNITISALYGITDSLLTDYSSAYLSYLNLDRPVGFLLADKSSYDKSQGYTIDDIESIMPGEKMYTKEEFYSFFDTLKEGKDKYSKDRNKISLLYSGDYHTNNCKSVTDPYLER